MPLFHRGGQPRLHHPQVREILAHQQTVTPGSGLVIVVRDLSGGGTSGVLHDVATGSPTWNVVRTRLLPGPHRPGILSLPDDSSDTLFLAEDVHLADPDSLRRLYEDVHHGKHASRTVVVATTAVTGHEPTAPFRLGDVEVVLPPLSVEDVGVSVESSTGVFPPPRLATALHTMTGGRVDLLTELLDGAPADIRAGRTPAAPDTWSVALSDALDNVTARATANTGPPQARQQLVGLLRAVAVGGGPSADPVPLPLLRDLVGELTAADDEVFSLVLRTVAGPAVEFRDPRHRAAVLQQTPPPVSADLHDRAAHAHTDPGRALYHRLQAVLTGGPGAVDDVVPQIRALASTYHDQGQWQAAADLLCILPDGADTDSTAEIVEALTRSGDLPAARLWSQGSLGPAPSVSFLAMHAGNRRRAYAALGDGASDSAAAPGVERQRALLAFADWDPHSMLEHATAADHDLLITVATSIIDGSGSTTDRPDGRHRLVDGWLSLVNDDPLTAREMLSSPLPALSSTLRIWRDAWLARTHYVLGDFETARRTVERGLATGDAHGSTLLDPLLLWTGAQVAAFQGDFSASHQYTSRLPDDPESFLIQRLPAAMSRMITTATSSDLVAALRVGESLARIGTEKDTQQPGFWPWEDVYAQCLVRAGKIRAADAVVTEAEQRAGARGLASVAAKLRVPRGSILLRRGDTDAGVRCFDEAVDIITDTPMRAYQSRILLEYGQVLRRLGRRRRADEIFGRAEEVFASMGAPAMVERCRRERRAAGISGAASAPTATVSGSGSGSGSTSGGLTTQEEQIAVMAADGSTNRDIARELTLSAKTVEHHLTSCYRKLGIRGRTELSGALQRR